jgi:imidazolonepropionase
MVAIYPDEPRLDAAGRVVMPGLVDPHTHLVFSGDRAAEFEQRLQGKTYMEILAAGGGILSTVRATRDANVEELKAQTRPRLQAMLRHGTTTAEAKTGYGLEMTSELRQLMAVLELDKEGPLELVPTFLGAHAVAPEFAGDPQGYTHYVCTEMLPALDNWWSLYVPQRQRPFVDVFCEKGAFDLPQSRAILEKARSLGFPLKIHVDEFENLGGVRLAVELGAGLSRPPGEDFSRGDPPAGKQPDRGGGAAMHALRIGRAAVYPSQRHPGGWRTAGDCH